MSIKNWILTMRIRRHISMVIKLAGKKYPDKALELAEFLFEIFPCRYHGIENCPECTSKLINAVMEVREKFENKLDVMIEKHFKEFMNDE